jgi:cell division septation protein DedD
MARNEEGEFELVLGNKQLLSVFFILVVLLGVFFTMGYIVGRNNPSTEAVNLALARKPADGVASQPKEVDATGAPVNEPRVVDSPKVVEPKAETKVEPPKPEPVKVDPPKPAPVKVEPPKPEPAKKEPPKPKEVPKPEPAAGPAGVVSKPPAGSYLQVAAIDLKGATMMVESLRKRSFPAVIMPGPADKPNIVRVLVGPMGSPEEVAKTRTRLEDIGMKGAMAKRL